MNPTAVNILSVPEPTFHWLNLLYAVISGVVGGIVIFYLSKYYEQKNELKKYKKSVGLIFNELYLNYLGIYNSYVGCLKNEEIDSIYAIENRNWNEYKMNLIMLMNDKLFLRIERLYSRLMTLNGKKYSNFDCDGENNKYDTIGNIFKIESELYEIIRSEYVEGKIILEIIRKASEKILESEDDIEIGK